MYICVNVICNGVKYEAFCLVTSTFAFRCMFLEVSPILTKNQSASRRKGPCWGPGVCSLEGSALVMRGFGG